MKIRVFSFLICVCLIFGMVFTGVSISAAEINEGIIEIGTVEAVAGESVVVPIKIKENPGIMAVTVSITYDPAVLQYETFYYGDVFNDYTLANHKDRKLIRLVICEMRNKRNDGNIISFKFKVNKDAKAELSKINLEYSKGDFCNWNLDKIMPQVVSGGVNVAFNGENCTHKEYGEWKVVTKPVCKDVGLKERACLKCKSKEYKEIPAIGHTYSDTWTVDRAATAEKEGTMSRYCIRCDDYVDRITFTLEQSEQEKIDNQIWQDISDKEVGEQIFKEQNPGEELTENKKPQNESDNSDGDSFDADSIINSILPDSEDEDGTNSSATEKLEAAFGDYKKYFKYFCIAAVILLFIVF